MIHPQVDSWRSRKRSPYRILLPLWIMMWVVTAFATAPWRHLTLYSKSIFWIPSAILFAIGFWLYRESSRDFSARQLGGIPELRVNDSEQQLATHGIRARVRHPVYLAHLLEMLAWSLGTGLTVCYLLTAFAILTGIFMIRAEEQELVTRFGEPYLQYQRTVPALIPRF